MRLARICVIPAVALAAVLIVWGGAAQGRSMRSTKKHAASSRGPIRLGIMDAITSAVPALVDPEAVTAADARVAAINAAGGINGRKLKLLVCNDNGDPNKAVTCANELIAKGVVALVASNGTETTSIYPILEAHGVASIGAQPSSSAIGDSPVALCLSLAAHDGFIGLPSVLKQHGAHVVSLIYPNDLGAASQAIVAAFQAGIKKAGVRVGAVAGYSIQSTQFGPVVASGLANGTQGVIAFNPGAATGPLVAAIKSQNPNVKVAVTASAWLPTVAGYLGKSGDGIFASDTGQPDTSNVPGIKMFNAQMSRYAPTTIRNSISIGAWTSTWAFQELVSNLKTITRASVLKATHNFKGLKLGGIYPTLSMNSKHPFNGEAGEQCAANRSIVFDQVTNGKLFPLKSGQFYFPFS